VEWGLTQRLQWQSAGGGSAHTTRRTGPRRRLRVLHVVESYGGGVAVALNCYVAATADDVDHVIVGFRRPGADIGWTSSAPFVELPSGHGRQHLAIRAAIRTIDADVIHAHSSWAGVASRTAVGRHGPPIVLTPHGYGFERTDVAAPLRATFRAVERILARRSAVVAAVSAREAHLAAVLRGDQPVVIVPHTTRQQTSAPPRGIDRADRSSPGSPLRIVTVGRVCRQKGVEMFCEIAASTAAWAAPPEFVWIGGGDVALTARLRRAGVEVTGWLPHELALERLGTADAYVHTAAWEAGSPISVLEAIERGLPIICRNIPALGGLPPSTLAATAQEISARLWQLGTDRQAMDDARQVSRRLADSLASSADQRHMLLLAYRAALRIAGNPTRRPPVVARLRTAQILRPAASQ
jgi:glycosyltransferase involved in cell wall biosynthesis